MINYIKEFSIIYRGGNILAEDRAKDRQVPGRIAPYFFLILERPGISQEDISKELRIDKGAVARTVKKMVDSGMVYREANPEDMRQYRIYPSEKLIRNYEACERSRLELEKIMTENIGAEELAAFEKVLVQMRNNVINAVEARKGSED